MKLLIILFFIFMDLQNRLNFRNTRNSVLNKSLNGRNSKNTRNSDSNTRVIMAKLETRLEAILKFFDTRTRSRFRIF